MLRAGRPGRRLGGPLLGLLLLLSPPALGDPGPVALRLEPAAVGQGGVASLRLEAPEPLRAVRVTAGERVVVLHHEAGGSRATAWIGVDLEEPPGPLPVRVEAEGERGGRLTGAGRLQVVEGRFPVQRLTLPRGLVELDAATLERVGRERAVLERLFALTGPVPLWREPFRSPLESGEPPRGFGLRRIINGEPRSPHTGVDFAAPAGTVVLAANAGVVVLSEEQFFGGQSVILDHGLGLYTMYFHLEARLLEAGRRVARGEPIGRVGSSGRATGPHLHWGVRLQGARVDPAALLRLVPER